MKASAVARFRSINLACTVAQSWRAMGRTKGHGLRGNGHEHQLHDQPVHQRTLGVMHPEARLTVLGSPLLRDKPGQFACGVARVFSARNSNGAGLGNGFRHRPSPPATCPADARLFEFGRRELGAAVARVAFERVGHAQFFQEPQHALRSGGFEVVNSQHGGDYRGPYPPLPGAWARSSGSAGIFDFAI